MLSALAHLAISLFAWVVYAVLVHKIRKAADRHRLYRRARLLRKSPYITRQYHIQLKAYHKGATADNAAPVL